MFTITKMKQFLLHWKPADFCCCCKLNFLLQSLFNLKLLHQGGPGSSVAIVTDYGLEGPGSNPEGDEIYRPSRPALASTQPPVKWVPGLSRG